jgi:hypothetical protein
MKTRLTVILAMLAIPFAGVLTTGSGVASANVGLAIIKNADELIPFLAPRHGLGADEIRSGFRSQAQLSDVRTVDDVNQMRNAWQNYQPRARAAGEITGRPATLPPRYRAVAQRLCQTAAGMLRSVYREAWHDAMVEAENHLTYYAPQGRELALYHDLADIARKFQSRCYCEAVAHLAVRLTRKALC